MGKKSKYPDYSGGSVQVDGRTVATASRKGNTVTTNYNMSDAERNFYNQIQGGMSESLGNLLNISDGQKQQWAQQLDAIKKQGVQNINDIYTPIETNLRKDIASRFGNMDNSVFMDNLNKITDKKASAIANLSNSLLSAQDSLYANELNNRINVITLLNNLNSAINNNMLNYTNAAAANSQSGNNYNQNAYQAAMASAASGLSGLGTLTSYLGNAGLASGNPYAMTLGAGLSYASKYV